MAITFKHVSESSQSNTPKQPKVDVKENKPTKSGVKPKKYTIRAYDIGETKYRHLYFIFSKIIAIFSLVLGIAASFMSLFFYWWLPSHSTESMLNVLKIIKLILVSCGLVISALFLVNCILTSLKRRLEIRVHVFNWMLFIFATSLTVISLLTPTKETLTRNIQNNLTIMSFMSIVFIMSFACMWEYSHGPEDACYIDVAGLRGVAFMFIFLAVVSLFQSISAFTLNAKPTITEGENAYFKLWSTTECILIASGCIVFGLVFTVMEDGTDFVVKTVFAGIMVALSVVPSIFVLICDQSNIYDRHILIGVMSVLGSAGSIAMTPVMFKSLL